ncbi:alpha-hydroxy acid oxidase [Streptomyces sp. NPDC050504]|uniref:alpha-hydroxy acid oxidase n=1 Tax=Streptomyces sp. NPDC050504 TaxID=3365618 RepID=UPI0037A37123
MSTAPFTRPARTEDPPPPPPAPPRLEALLTLAEVEHAAASRLPAAVRDFIGGGSGQERALTANRRALDAHWLVPRVLRDVTSVSPATRLAGDRAAFPAAVAPMAYQRIAHPAGEAAAAAAARAAGIPFVVPTLSSVPVEEIAATGASLWFQLYPLRDRGAGNALVERAEAAGCRALMVTADVPRMGRRLRDVRNAFALPPGISAVHLDGSRATGAQHTAGGTSAVARHTREIIDPAFDWRELERLAARTRLPLVVKGVLHPDDARRAADAGAACVVVSNHGGRQLDAAVSGFTVLPAVRDALGDDCQVLYDGAVRSGTDLLKALARGATGVLVGRPVLWGLAVAGQAGAEHVLTLLADETEEALALAGCRTPEEAAALPLIPATGEAEVRR